MIKSYKIRLYPTKKQEQQVWQHICACRYIWNYMLSIQQERHKNNENHLSAFSMMKLLTQLKNDGEHEWLYEVSNASLQITCQDLQNAYDGFFKKISGFPKFKSRKRSKPKFPIRGERFYFVDKYFVKIPKLGRIKYKTDFEFPIGSKNQFINPRISYVNGKYMLSFGIECENQASELTNISMGIDLGVKELAVVEFNGERIVFHNINKSQKIRTLKKRMKYLQRSISRKYEKNRIGNKYCKTKNIEKQEDKLRSIYARITNIRTNYINQTTHKLISLLPMRVVMEDLNVSGLMKNRHLSGAIQEQCLSSFIRKIKYKCEWNGIGFVQADRFFPSSKICSNCGCIKRNLRLSDRIYKCDECGIIIDRDYNAAVNLSKYVA